MGAIAFPAKAIAPMERSYREPRKTSVIPTFAGIRPGASLPTR
jgi:hypothetical protein